MSLKQLFFNAFASRTRPSADRILISSPRLDYECRHLREFLAKSTAIEIAPRDLQTIVESHLSSLTPEAFLYFLPAFMYASLKDYCSISVFAFELIGSLIKPCRTDVVETFENLARYQHISLLSEETMKLLHQEQLEFADSGWALAMFHERFDNLTPEEGKAILAFLIAFQEAHGEDFPFNELDKAIVRHWHRYRDVSAGKARC